MNIPAPPVLPDRIRQAREVNRYRVGIAKEIELLRHWANEIRVIRTAQSIRMLQRVDELRKLLDPAAKPTPGVPVLRWAAGSPR